MKIDYIEFPSGDLAATQRFFAKAFGWGFVDYGPGYHFAARLGGEEFCLFIDEPDAAKALVFAEDLREAFSQLHEAVGLPAGALSALIGLTHHDRGETVDLSLQRADAAMYDAKTQGRNRVRRVER